MHALKFNGYYESTYTESKDTGKWPMPLCVLNESQTGSSSKTEICRQPQPDAAPLKQKRYAKLVDSRGWQADSAPLP